MKKRDRRAGAGETATRRPPIPFGPRMAQRRYVWTPPAGRPHQVDLEIGSPVHVGRDEWACAFKIVGLPKTIDTAAHGFDAVQALELALVGAGALLSRSPQFRAGQVAMWEEPVQNAAELLLPLPLNAIQGTLENLRAYLERQREKERKSRRDWFNPEWRRALLSAMNEISGNLATLAVHLPIASPRSLPGPAGKLRGRRGDRGGAGRSHRRRPSASRTPRSR